MEKSSSHFLIEAIVRNAIKRMEDSPERSIRNLVDMALQFSEGHFQQDFFELVQTMLQDEHSSYYALLQDIFAHVNHDTLVTVGMNAGYNGFVKGTKRIREIQAECGYKVPWLVSLRLDTEVFIENESKYHNLVAQGEEIGIYDWQIFTSSPQILFPFIQQHPDSIFVMYCTAKDVSLAFLDSASSAKNLMVVLKYDEDASEACCRMRDAKLMYSLWYQYQENSAVALTSGDLWCDVQQLHPIFTILMPERRCPDSFRKRVYDRVILARKAQQIQTILWEAEQDSDYIANVMAQGSRPAGFDEKGQLYTNCEYSADSNLNIFRNDLNWIFQHAFPVKSANE